VCSSDLARHFCFSGTVQAGYGAYPASIAIDFGILCGCKVDGDEVKPLTSVLCQSYVPALPLYVLMSCTAKTFFFIFDSGIRIVFHVDHVILSIRNTGGNVSVTEQPFCFGISDWIHTV
jgi:hypothetical protein